MSENKLEPIPYLGDEITGTYRIIRDIDNLLDKFLDNGEKYFYPLLTMKYKELPIYYVKNKYGILNGMHRNIKQDLEWMFLREIILVILDEY